LLFQSTKPDKLRAFSLATGKWETAEINGDQPPEVKGHFQGYCDPARNVIVCCKGLDVWIYRYSAADRRR
jgi:hypothetical protein